MQSIKARGGEKRSHRMAGGQEIDKKIEKTHKGGVGRGQGMGPAMKSGHGFGKILRREKQVGAGGGGGCRGEGKGRWRGGREQVDQGA